MNILVIVLLSILAALLLLFTSRIRDSNKSNPIKKKKKVKKGEATSTCPLCNSLLYKGDNLVSRIYNGFDKRDQACTIHGCPYCYPVIELGLKRICPVCHKNVPINGHLDAHLFIRENGKKHVHITGCTECHKKK